MVIGNLRDKMENKQDQDLPLKKRKGRVYEEKACMSERKKKKSPPESWDTSNALVVHQDGPSSPSSALVLHQDGTSSPFSALVVHQDGTPSPSSAMVVNQDETTLPSSALVVYQDGTSSPSSTLVVHQDGTSSPSSAMTDSPSTRTFSDHDQNMEIFPGHRHISGVLADDILKTRISEAKKTFTRTQSFQHVTRILNQFGHVTICGASGEGKTTMALMLARDCLKEGYEVCFVERVDTFDYNEVVSSTCRLFFIFDDIFGTVGLSTDTSHIKNLINSIKSQIQERKAQKSRKDRQSTQSSNDDQQKKQQEKKAIRVVFTSKTYNFKDGISKLQYERLSMFTGHTVVDLTTNKEHCYSDEEKIAIFKKHKLTNPSVDASKVTEQDIRNLETSLFGFPLTCRLYFEFPTFEGCVKDFFKRPLFYLRIEINKILSLNNHQAAALILMLLCENKLDLVKLESKDKDHTMDEMFQFVLDIVPSVTRSRVATAARNFRGTFLSGGDTVGFAHSSIYDACACALFQFNPSFVLQHCSIHFLYERLRSGHVEESTVTDHLHFIFVSDSYHALIAKRLVEFMKSGNFSKSLTHVLLKNEHFLQIICSKLQSEACVPDTDWIRQKDRGKGILYWAVQGHSVKLVQESENLLGIRFTQDEITEALEGCVERDNLVILKFLLSKLQTTVNQSHIQYLLWLSGENGSWETAQYLLRNGAEINVPDKNYQNYLHIICKAGRFDTLRSLISQVGILVIREKYSLAINSTDINGRTPLMAAAVNGSWECFQLICGDSKLDVQDLYGNSVIHLAARSGNRDIVQHVLTHSNINNTGQHGWTPVMFAAVSGQKRLFDFLVSQNAALSLVDDFGNNLLYLACQGGNRDIVEHVLTSSNINSRGQYGWTPVMNAAVSGQKSVFDFLVSRNADPTLVDEDGDGLLHLACQGGNIYIVQHVLTLSNINSRGHDGLTPVMNAAVSGKKSVFDFLVSCNADLTLVDEDGDGLLHLACQGGNKDIVQHVLTSSNINSRGRHGRTPVMNAAICGQKSVFDFLVSHNADLTLICEDGDSLLHLACQGGNRDIVEHVLTPSNINNRGKNGWTPVMNAAVSGQQSVFDFLVSQNAGLTLVDEDGDSLIHLACQGGNRYIVEHVLTSSNINSRGKNGRTPVMNAAVSGQQSVFDFLVSQNADLTLVDEDGDSLIHLACQGGNRDIVERVLTSSNINSRGKNGRTPVMNAAICGQKSVFDFLASQNADLTLVDEDGDSLVHLACQGGNSDIVQVLTPSNSYY